MVPSNRFCSPYGTILKRKRCKTEVWHQVFLRSPLGVKEWVWVLMQSPGQGKEQIHHWLLGELAFPTPSWCLGYLGLESYHEFERHFFLDERTAAGLAPGGFPLFKLFFGPRSALRLWMGVRKSRAASINLKAGLSWPDTSALNLPMTVALTNQQTGH